MGNGVGLRVGFSDMDALFKASSKDSRVAERSCTPGMGRIGIVPGWGCSGVSATSVSGWLCVDSMGASCGRDWAGLAGIVRVVKKSGYSLSDPRTTRQKERR